MVARLAEAADEIAVALAQVFAWSNRGERVRPGIWRPMIAAPDRAPHPGALIRERF